MKAVLRGLSAYRPAPLGFSAGKKLNLERFFFLFEARLQLANFR